MKDTGWITIASIAAGAGILIAGMFTGADGACHTAAGVLLGVPIGGVTVNAIKSADKGG